MPIKVTCQCGKSFAAKDELAGKAVKCPNCQQPLRIPGGTSTPAKAAAPKAAGTPAKAAGAPAKPAAKPAAKPTPKPAAKPAAKPPSGSSSGIGIGEEVQPFGLSDSALSEVGLMKQAANARPCPGCTAPLALDAVICIKCGFNTILGRRMDTIKVGNKGGPEGHGALTAELMERAADTMDEDANEEKKKTGEGMPWWGYLLGMLGLVGFMATMTLMEQEQAIFMAGCVIITCAVLLGFYSGIRILIEAFNESFVQGLLYLFIPLYPLFYVITRWDKVGTYFIMNLGASVIAVLGYGAIIVSAWFKKDPSQIYVPRSNPPAIVVHQAEVREPAATPWLAIRQDASVG